MPATLVDSNVVLDILTEDPEWLDWSAAALARQADAGPLVVDDVLSRPAHHRAVRGSTRAWNAGYHDSPALNSCDPMCSPSLR